MPVFCSFVRLFVCFLRHNSFGQADAKRRVELQWIAESIVGAFQTTSERAAVERMLANELIGNSV